MLLVVNELDDCFKFKDGSSGWNIMVVTPVAFERGVLGDVKIVVEVEGRPADDHPGSHRREGVDDGGGEGFELRDEGDRRAEPVGGGGR